MYQLASVMTDIFKGILILLNRFTYIMYLCKIGIAHFTQVDYNANNLLFIISL